MLQLLTTVANLARVLIPGSSLHCSGRSSVAAGGVRAFDFPGTSVHARILGSSVVSAIINETGTNRYAVSVDGGHSWLDETVNTTVGRHEYTLCDGLPKNVPHDFVLLKLTEACSAALGCSWGDFGTCSLVALQLDDGASAQPPQRMPWLVDDIDQPAASRRLQFIGDSITAAWGARSDASAVDDASCNRGEDARSGWALQTARLLKAEAHVIAWGGVGLVLNDEACTRPEGAAAPELWKRSLANDPASEWDMASWVPHVVVIHLGTNDLCCGNEVSRLPHARFEDAYVEFIQRVGGAYARRAAGQGVGDASSAAAAPLDVFLGCGPMGNSKGNRDHTGREFYFPCSVIRRVASRVNAAATSSSSSSSSTRTSSGRQAGAAAVRAHVLDFSGLMDDKACVGGCSHPSERCHALMAETAAKEVTAALKWDSD